MAIKDGHGQRKFPLILLTFFFVFLAMHPFPDWATFVCPVAGAQPQLVPGRFLQPLAMLWESGAPPGAWVTDVYVASIVMNVAVCAAIGVSLVWWGKYSWRFALVFGGCLSLVVETTQVTGLWGLYPCAYRQFDVDDLLLNILGVMLGFLIGRRFLKEQ